MYVGDFLSRTCQEFGDGTIWCGCIAACQTRRRVDVTDARNRRVDKRPEKSVRNGQTEWVSGRVDLLHPRLLSRRAELVPGTTRAGRGGRSPGRPHAGLGGV